MATRTYCDQCGNTCHSPNKLMFGSHSIDQFGILNVQQGGLLTPPSLGHPFGTVSYPNKPAIVVSAPARKWFNKIIIDLCDTCAPVWMERVKALTKESDPDV